MGGGSKLSCQAQLRRVTLPNFDINSLRLLRPDPLIDSPKKILASRPVGSVLPLHAVSIGAFGKVPYFLELLSVSERLGLANNTMGHTK